METPSSPQTEILAREREESSTAAKWPGVARKYTKYVLTVAEDRHINFVE
jgi:hypothetical protein